MKYYGQSLEDKFVFEYFRGYTGNLLDCGANNGELFSNSKLLIEHGWEAWCLEPSRVCSDLMMLHQGNPKVHIFNYGIGEREEIVKFWESGTHVHNGTDIGLVSTTNFEETKRWPDVEFTEREIQVVPFEKFYEHIEKPQLDFISIDCEGSEWNILQQIDLEKVGCKALCIEYNGNNELGEKFANYCKGYQVGFISGENLIFVKA